MKGFDHILPCIWYHYRMTLLFSRAIQSVLYSKMRFEKKWHLLFKKMRGEQNQLSFENWILYILQELNDDPKVMIF